MTVAEYRSAYYFANKAKHQQRARDYYKRNKEELKAKSLQYYYDNHEERKAYCKARRLKDKEI